MHSVYVNTANSSSFMNLYVIKSPQGDRTGDQFCPGFCSSLKWKQMLIHNCPLPSSITPCRLPRLPPQSLSKPWRLVGVCVCRLMELNGTGRRRGVWISPSSEGIDRYWGYGTVMWMLIQHLKVFRSHSCQTETRTRAPIDCIMARWTTMYSGPFSSPSVL